MQENMSSDQVNFTHLNHPFNSEFPGLNSDSRGDPHPRPTSAPPELLRITKEGLFAFSSGSYINKLSTDTEQLPSLKNFDQSRHEDLKLLDMMASKNGISTQSIRQLLGFNNQNINIFDKKNSILNDSKDDFVKKFEATKMGTDSSRSTDTDIPHSNLQNSTMDSLLNSIGLNTCPPSISPTSQSTRLAGASSHFSSPQNNSQYHEHSPHNANYSNLTQDYKPLNNTFYGSNVSFIPFDPNYVTNHVQEYQNPASVKNYSKHDNYPDLLNQYPQLHKNHYNNGHTQTEQSYESMYGHGQQVSNTCNMKTNPESTPEYLSSHTSNPSRSKHNSNRSNSSKPNNRKPSPRPRPNPGLAPLEELAKNDSYKGRVVAIAKDQAGGRMLQSKLDVQKPEHINAIFDEALDHIVELMTDPFANYLCQKLMEVCTVEQMNKIIDKVSPELVNISLNMHGTRAVQKLVDMLYTSEQVEKITKALNNFVVPLVKDLNGNHVIQKCLFKLQPKDCDFIYYAMIGHCADVASHRHGCCVLQRCIDAANAKQKALLIEEICQNATSLVKDPFGNYVVQYILNLKDEEINGKVIMQLSKGFEQLAKQKFSSNVVEKCLTVGNAEQQKAIIYELLQGGKTSLKELLLDAFANYVVQRALHVAKEPELNLLLEGIRPCIEDLQSSTPGKKVVAKLLKKFSSLSLLNNTTIPTPNNEYTRIAPVNNMPQVPMQQRRAMHLPNEQPTYGDFNTQAMMEHHFNRTGMSFYPQQGHVNISNQISSPNYGHRMAMDKNQPTLLLAENIAHHGRYPSQTPAFTSTPDPYVTPRLQPHAYPNHPSMFYPNELSHFQVPSVYSPAHNYIPNSEMHLLSSPQIVGLQGSYNNSNFNRMSSLNLNTAYPTNASSTGWA